MQRFLPSLYYSNLHIPLIGWMLLEATAQWMQVEVEWTLVVLAAAGVFIVYQVDHGWWITASDRINQPERVAWVTQHRAYMRGSVGVAGLLSCYVLSANTHLVSLPSAVLAALGLAYGGAWGLKRRLRIPLLKPLLITSVWTYGTTIWPMVSSGTSLSIEHIGLLIGVRFCWIGANVWLAEGVDQKGDRYEGFDTLPSAAKDTSYLVTTSLIVLMVGGCFAIGLSIMLEQWTMMGVEVAGFVVSGGIVVYGYRWQSLATPAQRWLRDVLVAWPGLGAVWL
ncbi:MAG: hypothetical protein RhofKO_09700 [Rhodothermales bacterium]